MDCTSWRMNPSRTGVKKKRGGQVRRSSYGDWIKAERTTCVRRSSAGRIGWRSAKGKFLPASSHCCLWKCDLWCHVWARRYLILIYLLSLHISCIFPSLSVCWFAWFVLNCSSCPPFSPYSSIYTNKCMCVNIVLQRSLIFQINCSNLHKSTKIGTHVE